MFATIATGGKQYNVRVGDSLRIEKLTASQGDSITFDQVLCVGDEKGTKIGQPLVSGASVQAEVVAQARARKVMVFKFRRRQNSKRRNGHRQHYTEIKITDINAG